MAVPERQVSWCASPSITTQQTPVALLACECAEMTVARRQLAASTHAALKERGHRRRLEFAITEDLGQELAGIAFMVGALQRTPEDQNLDRASRLQNIADLLAAAIDRCVRVTHES